MRFAPLLLPGLFAASQLLAAETVSGFREVACEGTYPKHLQGVCTNERDAVYWSWTDTLVKTDRDGHLLQRVPVAPHHGDLCFHEGKVYIAVNLGKFNRPAGEARSFVYAYDGGTLAEVARYPVPELVYGAGGMAWHAGKFLVVGGLPPGATENYLYEYDEAFRFQTRHTLASGYTLMGIQTAAFAEGSWWFGCYGEPHLLLRADEAFHLTGKWEIEAALGIVSAGPGRLLVAKGKTTPTREHEARLLLARPDQAAGLIFEPTAKHP